MYKLNEKGQIIYSCVMMKCTHEKNHTTLECENIDKVVIEDINYYICRDYECCPCEDEGVAE